MSGRQSEMNDAYECNKLLERMWMQWNRVQSLSRSISISCVLDSLMVLSMWQPTEVEFVLPGISAVLRKQMLHYWRHPRAAPSSTFTLCHGDPCRFLDNAKAWANQFSTIYATISWMSSSVTKGLTRALMHLSRTLQSRWWMVLGGGQIADRVTQETPPRVQSLVSVITLHADTYIWYHSMSDFFRLLYFQRYEAQMGFTIHPPPFWNIFPMSYQTTLYIIWYLWPEEKPRDAAVDQWW